MRQQLLHYLKVSMAETLPTEAFLSSKPEFKESWRPSAAARALWEAHSPLQRYELPHSSDDEAQSLVYLSLPNPSASDVILIVPGFNEGLVKYVQVSYELHTAGFSVVVYDHRGQGLSDREPHLVAEGREQNGHIEDFDGTLVADCVAIARDIAAPGHRRLHVLAHSMGGE